MYYEHCKSIAISPPGANRKKNFAKKFIQQYVLISFSAIIFSLNLMNDEWLRIKAYA